MQVLDRFSLEDIIATFVGWTATALPNTIATLLILLGGLIVSSWLARRTRRVIEENPQIDNTFAGTLSSIVRYAAVFVVLIAALSQLGFETTSLLAALGAIGLAIGLALQGTLANIAAGIMLLWLRPFRVGDVIDGGGATGKVHDVGLFATELHTFDGLFEFVPNSELWARHITNYSRLPQRMVDLTFGISYTDDIGQAQRLLLDLAKSDTRVLDHPTEAFTFVSSLDDSCVTLALRVWVTNDNYWAVKRTLTENAKARLEQAGLSIPFPQLDVHGLPSPNADQGRNH